MSATTPWWDSLRHMGLFFGPNEVRVLAKELPVAPLNGFQVAQLRREVNRLEAGQLERGAYVARVLELACGLTGSYGEWQRGSAVDAIWTRQLITGESRKPAHLWADYMGGYLPVFIEASSTHLGIGKSRKFVSDIAQWLRLSKLPVALATNTRQWRLIYAGLDYEASCEADAALWFEEGEPGPQLLGLRHLLQPALYRKQASGQLRIEELVNEARKGQVELSAVLGERVREAVEILVRAHGQALKDAGLEREGADIYRAAVRVVMRMVVVLFAESRELLPLSNPHYFSSYSLQGLIESLQKLALRGGGRMDHRFSAWPRVLALFQLIYRGSHHEALQVPEYAGELFEPGTSDAPGADMRALHVFETACFNSLYHDSVSDRVVWKVFDLLTRTRVRIRQGRGATQVVMPVDFSALSSEYIGILYEGLLDYELRTVTEGDPIIFLAVGNEPALPLSRLEQMGDKQIRELLENLKDKSSGDDEDAGEDASGGEVGEEEEADADADSADDAADDETSDSDSDTDSDSDDGEGEDESVAEDTTEQARQRALFWARKVVELAKLVRAPRGNSPEQRLVHEQKVETKARQLVRRIVLPGEWYLVRWGGTRKGSGTFYTRPQLAVPTVLRTLRPLACEQNAQGEWIPRRPEVILALQLCDPSCGSGSFVLAGLRYLTEVLYQSLFVHGRLQDEEDRTLLHLLGERGSGAAASLSDELIPCRVSDEHFEGRVKAVLRRHIVERCIYGVDIDPLSVELCRLSLWIETMDRSLPFSFIDHKIRCGNSLVGAWFDQFQHYPAMAWKNREGGDKAHTNGVYFAKESLTNAIKQWTKDVLTPDLARFLGGNALFDGDLQSAAMATHRHSLDAFQALHAIPIHQSRLRAQRFRELLASPAYQQLKDAFDRWCACWFWPGDQLDDAPLPSTFHQPPPETDQLTRHIAATKRFFHWELEFPDVFASANSGFDAIIGNPPWEIAKPNSKEFFSNIDPLYRAYGKQEAIRKQADYFADRAVEQDWIHYLADLKALGNFLRFSANPFGDPELSDKSPDKFSIARGKANAEVHQVWRQARQRTPGYVDPEHPFRHQGSADINLYKLFLETAHALLRRGGRMGMIIPSGLYSDNGTGALRELFIHHCSWEWLFGFENRDKLFDIDSRFKFNPVIVEKGGHFTEIQIKVHDDLPIKDQLEKWEIYLGQDRKGLIPLSASGSGLKTVILVLLNLIVIPKVEDKPISHYVFAFEELENNLHPALLRSLLKFLETYMVENGSTLFLTTHSNTALDVFGVSPNAQIYHVTHDGESGNVAKVSAHFDHVGVISELGAKPSDLLQANGIIWVEGPSDRVYINRWLEIVTEGQLKEGRDYQCAFYAGALLARTSFTEPDGHDDDLVNLLRINSNIVVVCDGDRNASGARLKDRALRIKKEVEKVPGAHIWITKAREIENYIPAEVLATALNVSPVSDPEQFQHFFPKKREKEKSFIERKLKQKNLDKMQLAIACGPHMTLENMSPRFDWAEQVRLIAKAIQRWNQ